MTLNENGPAPSITLYASALLWPEQEDFGRQLMEWINSPEVQAWVNAQAKLNLNNPLFAGVRPQVRERWRAFAMIGDRNVTLPLAQHNPASRS